MALFCRTFEQLGPGTNYYSTQQQTTGLPLYPGWRSAACGKRGAPVLLRLSGDRCSRTRFQPGHPPKSTPVRAFSAGAKETTREPVAAMRWHGGLVRFLTPMSTRLKLQNKECLSACADCLCSHLQSKLHNFSSDGVNHFSTSRTYLRAGCGRKLVHWPVA